MARRKPKELELNAYEQLLNAYVRCFNSPEGQVVLADLKAAYQDKSSVVGVNSALVFDVNRTMVLEGARLVYLRIVGMIEEGEHGRSTATGERNDRDQRNESAGITGNPEVFDA